MFKISGKDRIGLTCILCVTAVSLASKGTANLLQKSSVRLPVASYSTRTRSVGKPQKLFAVHRRLSFIGWVSKRQFLYARYPFGQTPRFFKHDIVTGVDTFLPHLKTGMEIWPDIKISPDGQWLLWRQLAPGSSTHPFEETYEICSSRIDGSEFRRWPERSPLFFWSEDSRAWVQVFRDNEVKKPCYKIYSSDTSRPQWKAYHEVFAPIFDQRSEDVFWTGNSQLRIIKQQQGPLLHASATMYHVSLQGQVQQQTIHFPRKVSMWQDQSGSYAVGCIAFNRQGTRIVWALKDFTSPSYERIFEKMFKGGKTSRAEEKQSTAELSRLYAAPLYIWSCDQNGKNWKLLARLAGEDISKLPSGDYFSKLQWLPDGKSVSFVYHNALWRLPA